MKTIYWITTLLTSLYLIWSAYGFLFSKAVIQGVEQLGFPGYFRIQLAILKIIAVFVILIPPISVAYKDWAYVGIGLFYLTGIVAHFAHKDPIAINLINFLLFILLVVSNVYLKKMIGILS